MFGILLYFGPSYGFEHRHKPQGGCTFLRCCTILTLCIYIAAALYLFTLYIAARSHAPQLIIMDEVDGMSAGDRGGVADLIQTIHKTKASRGECLLIPFKRMIIHAC